MVGIWSNWTGLRLPRACISEWWFRLPRSDWTEPLRWFMWSSVNQMAQFLLPHTPPCRSYFCRGGTLINGHLKTGKVWPTRPGWEPIGILTKINWISGLKRGGWMGPNINYYPFSAEREGRWTGSVNEIQRALRLAQPLLVCQMNFLYGRTG